jgi:hypothetical protein
MAPALSILLKEGFIVGEFEEKMTSDNMLKCMKEILRPLTEIETAPRGYKWKPNLQSNTWCLF